jgi:hypothetical protein
MKKLVLEEFLPYRLLPKLPEIKEYNLNPAFGI